MSSYYGSGAGKSGSGNRSSYGGGYRSSGALGSAPGPEGPPASGQAPRRRDYGAMMDRYLHDTTTQVSDRYSGHQDPIDNDRHRLEVLQRKERREKEAKRLAEIAKGNGK
ncbi:hypothetical protein B0T20DRAFT_421473 [Sordaria brevicollis]|uniref:Uncharacterized protein n=1 Tax=Sordaria brevicollis TaxID=83679 RepID=A0AAE0P3A9_SORBR|nr:hypothetical protein B0T20DRAFT_421473 [Sordaria brevicollis]